MLTEITICSNTKRETRDMLDHHYIVYIPMNNEEKNIFASHVENACWRLIIKK